MHFFRKGNPVNTYFRFSLSTVQICIPALLFFMSGCLQASIEIDFESLPDSTIITNQYPGLTFRNAIILTAGISLNEFEFPPYSGMNVISDNGGPITIDFSTPVLSFGGYFTYLEPLTVEGFDGSNTEVASAASLFSSNDALFGDSGSRPNEFIDLTSASAISSVTITGDPIGGSFTLDDATYMPEQVAVAPEPASFFLLLTAATGLFAIRKCRQT